MPQIELDSLFLSQNHSVSFSYILNIDVRFDKDQYYLSSKYDNLSQFKNFGTHWMSRCIMSIFGEIT